MCSTQTKAKVDYNDDHVVEKQKEESPEEASARRKATVERFAENFSAWDLINPNKPWVLVENGSFGGFFDWLPEHVRVGPWSVAALSFLSAIFYLSFLAGAYFYSEISQPWWPSATSAAADTEQTTSTMFDTLEYPAVGSYPWYYQVVVFCYMIFIIVLIAGGPNGLNAWGTYTVQSWTLLTIRHGLCALAPFYRPALVAAEWIRFPAACSATITYVVWNFVLMPFIYYFGMKTDDARQKFLAFFTNFRLTNIHVMNIVFCVLNCGPWGSPRRDLAWIDLYASFVSMMYYMSFYFFILDRLGFHMYPIFSPRTGTLTVVAAWSFLWASYFVTFLGWQHFLKPPSSSDVY